MQLANAPGLAQRIKSATGAPPARWNLDTATAVTAAPAAYGTSFSSPVASDSIYFGVSGTTGTSGNNQGITTNTSNIANGWFGGAGGPADAKVFKVSNLYAAATPDLKWYAYLAANYSLQNGGITLSLDGSKVFALAVGTSDARLYCFAAGATGAQSGNAAAATNCTGWSAAYLTLANGVQYQTPWYDVPSGDLFVGDKSGNLIRINGANGTQRWAVTLAQTFVSALGTPLVWNGVAYIGDEYGRFWRIKNLTSYTSTTAPSATGSDVASIDLCGTAPGTCTAAQWAVRSSPAIDVTVDKVYIAAGGIAFEFPSAATSNWQVSAQKTLVASPTLPIYSSPGLDPDNNWLYVGFNNALYKVKYPFTGGTSANVYSTTVNKSGSDASYPRASPLPYNSNAYIPTAGAVERYACTASASSVAPSFRAITGTGSTTTLFGTATTTAVLDSTASNIVYGYTNGTAGGIVQYPQTTAASWICPSGTSSIAGLSCSTDSKCSTGCATAANCPGTNQATTTCSAPTCGGTCNTGYADCNNDKNTDGCETQTSASPSNCGGCGTVCSSNHITTPTCTSSVCGGTCDSGYANCDSNASNGCESTTSCSAGGCCGATCSSGQMCNGTTKTCVTSTITQCATVSEHQNATISCPGGTKISSITFASYGTPTGSPDTTCTSTYSTSSCDSANSTSIVQNLCVGQTSCTIVAENATTQGGGTFGDPCSGTFKRLYIKVRCGC